MARYGLLNLAPRIKRVGLLIFSGETLGTSVAHSSFEVSYF